ncbi:DUF72 domain-containing protein [Luteimonas composti]|uniref:DUF72 domain-containing protein n=1 Tax=Luteimonas composti TaxID=398257 RepID=A0ABT6MMK1_9GAMM|nr:DUF72 domain-containing protein [Luteimonas composti]MDH7451525.1 DUF72 domain-containing protein [Luteimonas composti]
MSTREAVAGPGLDLPDAGVPAVDGIRVGIGGWTYAPWRANFYPAGLVQRRELEYASRQLSAIEINGTYYGAQKPATYAKWRDETPPGFVFTAKAPKRITQSRALQATGAQVEDFVGGIAELDDRLAALVWQFDAGVRIDRDAFAAFLDLLPRQARGRPLRHVLDVRDRGFVDAGYVALARAHGMATVFTDSPEHPSFADATADFVYARLMRARADVATGYPVPELRAWAARARAWAGGDAPDDPPLLDAPAQPGPARDVFVFFISAAKERNPAAAMELLRLLGARDD